jgi:hypothetical protein
VTHTRRWIDSPDDEHGVARNMYRIEINIKKKNCASSWSFTRIISLIFDRVIIDFSPFLQKNKSVLLSYSLRFYV